MNRLPSVTSRNTQYWPFQPCILLHTGNTRFYLKKFRSQLQRPTKHSASAILGQNSRKESTSVKISRKVQPKLKNIFACVPDANSSVVSRFIYLSYLTYDGVYVFLGCLLIIIKLIHPKEQQITQYTVKNHGSIQVNYTIVHRTGWQLKIINILFNSQRYKISILLL